MAVPKKKTSKRRGANRTKANMKAKSINLTKCSQCGEPKMQHVVCSTCGHYGGKKILDIKSKLDKKLRKEKKIKEENSENK